MKDDLSVYALNQMLSLIRISLFSKPVIEHMSLFFFPILAFGALFCGCQASALREKTPVPDSLLQVQKPLNLKIGVKSLNMAVDTGLYNKKMLALSNGDTTGLWPVKFVCPLPGAILPFSRVVAFYGNLYSKKMGILGEIPKDSMFKKLQAELAKWKFADSLVPVIPALHYIAVTAQGSPGKDGKYRLRMPFHQIDTVIKWAKEINALVFLDIQVALSDVKTEISLLEPYLTLPNVNLGIDPEFSMKQNEKPGTKIGSFNAGDINAAIDFLATVVKKNNLAPKILIVHRFTQGMVTDYEKIKRVPQVQVVMDMDGWGSKILKAASYKRYIYNEPVEFAGLKLFYKNDFKKNKYELFEPEEILKFTPNPIYIQYQ